MSEANIELGDIHWLMDILQNIDVGLVVLDRNYDIQLWNGFMESHSGLSPQVARGENLFTLFPEIPKDWFCKKAAPVFELRTRTFTIWEQRPYLFRFKNYRPITGRASVMYQNTSMIPLESIDRQVNHICLIVYDVTDIAVSRGDTETAVKSLTERNRTDLLTGLLNRLYWIEETRREFSRCQRSERPSTLVLFEIDDFRRINIEFGHPAGDHLLKILADGLVQTLRDTDLVCRYDGGTFAALLVDSNEDEANVFAQRIYRLSEMVNNSGLPEGVSCSLSLGIARYSDKLSDSARWIQAAEATLQQARDHGGNQICIHQP